MKEKLILIFVLVTNLSFSQMTLKDSLLMTYSEKQLNEMSVREIGNAVRKLRGLNPIPIDTLSELNISHRFNQTEIDSIQKLIDIKVNNIISNESNYLKKVYPNSYVDIINRFENGFYKNIQTRELRHLNYRLLHYNLEGDESFDLVNYPNNSKRKYYFDQRGMIMKIYVETGKNVNPGKKYDTPFSLQNQRISFYLWNEELLFVKKLTIGKDFDGLVSSLNENDTLNEVTVSKFYFFKGNCFSAYSATEKLKNVEDELIDKVKLSTDYCDFELVPMLRNYMQEYSEFVNGTNDYLSPHKSSYSYPYIIDPIEN